MAEIKLLVVEDDPCFKVVLRLFLKDFTQNITIHDNAESAMDSIDEGEKFDMIISDFNLPGENGDYVLKKLRKKGDKTPYIILSANKDIKTDCPDIDGLANEMLEKSTLNRESLVATIKKVLQKAQNKIRLLKSPITASL